MALRATRLAAALLPLAAAACTHELGRVSALSIRPEPAPVRIVQRDVSGRHCVWPRPFDLTPDLAYPDLGAALGDALEGVPGADALVEVDVEYRVRFLVATCFEVHGDAVALE